MKNVKLFGVLAFGFLVLVGCSATEAVEGTIIINDLLDELRSEAEVRITEFENRLDDILESFEGDEQYQKLTELNNDVNALPGYSIDPDIQAIVSEIRDMVSIEPSILDETYCIIADVDGCLSLIDIGRHQMARARLEGALARHRDYPSG